MLSEQAAWAIGRPKFGRPFGPQGGFSTNQCYSANRRLENSYAIIGEINQKKG